MKKFHNLYALFGALFIFYLFVGFSSNPPAQRTGAPGESTCASGCHTGNSNNFDGDITFSGFPTMITPNQSYPITVTVTKTQGNVMNAGFELTTLIDNGNTNAGSYTAGTNMTMTSGGGKTYLRHAPKLNFGGSSTVSWTYDWTAPNVGAGETITLYGVTVLGNGGGNSGDFVVTNNMSGTVVGGGAPVEVAITSSSNIDCNGASNGSATAQASEGMMPYNYAWSNGSSGPTATNLPPGPATVTVTDGANDMATATVMITQPSAITINLLSQTNIDCTNNVGTAAVSATGGTGNKMFSWSNGESGSSAFNLPAGMNTVTATDNNGCTETLTINITTNTSTPNINIANPDQLTCINTTATLDATSSATGNQFSYNWTTSSGNIISGANTPTPTVNLPAVYTLVVTDNNNGCSNSSDVVVTSNTTPPIINIQTPGTLTCLNGSVTLDATNSSPNVSYNWTTVNGNIISGANTATPTVGSAGVYQLTISSFVNGCTATSAVEVQENSTTPIVQIATPQILTFNNTTITLDASGSTQGADITYLWTTVDGNIVSGGVTLNPVVDTEGTYCLTVTNTSNGCETTNCVLVQSNTNIPVADAGPAMTLDCNTTTITLNGTGSSTGTNITYSWTTSDGNIISGSTTTTPTIDAPGTYMITVTDTDSGGQATSTVIVNSDTQAPMVDAGEDIILFCGDDTVTLSAISSVPNGTYQWTTSNGMILMGANSATAVVQGQGTYTVTVVNLDNGCENIDDVNVTVVPNVAIALVSTTNVSCNGFSDGTAEVVATGGTTPYNFAWSNGGSGTSQSGLPAGNYTVTVTDATQCQDVISIDITEPAAIAPNATATSETSNGAMDGTATANPMGGSGTGYTYMWSNNESTQTITNLAPGNYTVTVMDSNQCTGTQTVTVNSFDCNIAVTASIVTAIACNNDMTGSVTATASGTLTQPVEYQWSNNMNGQTISDLPAGIYTVTLTDAANCTATSSIELTEPDLLALTITDKIDVLCAEAMSGGATAVATGGTGNYTFDWSNGFTGNPITGLPGGTYTVTVTDENQCQATASFEILIGNGLEVTMSSQAESAAGVMDGSATATPINGAGSYTYLWSTNETTQTIQNLGPGDYCVTVTDSNGCPFEGCVVISPFNCDPFTINTTTTSVTCNGGSDGSAEITVTGGQSPYLINWPNGENGMNLSAGAYDVTIIDALNCTEITTVVITEPSEIIVQTTITNATCTNPNGSVTFDITGGTAPYMIDGPNADELPVGTYTFIVTDINGCTQDVVVVIDLDPDTTPPTAIAQDITVGLNATGTATITAMMIGNMSTDDCGDVTLFINTTTFDCSNIGMNTVLLSVSDAAGNVSTDEAIVTVEDGISPVIVCPENIISNSCNGVDYDLPVATDNCTTNPDITLVEGLESGAVFPVGVTSITYQVTDESGNLVTCSFTVTVEAPGELILDSEDISCNGEMDGSVSVGIEGGSGDYTYTWNTPNMDNTAEVGNLPANNYTVMISDGNGCEFTGTVSVEEPDALEIEVTEVINESTPGTNGIITVNVGGGTGGLNYSWINEAGDEVSQDEDLLNAVAGVYTLTVTDDNGCTLTSEMITVEFISSVNELNLVESFQAFPNPTDNYLTIKIDLSEVATTQLSILDMTGKEVLRAGQLTTNRLNSTIDVSQLPKGLYLLKVQINGQIQSEKLIIW